LGIDLDHNALRTNSNVARRVCANCCSLPFRSETVDIIVCQWVFEHLESPERAMREFARVLKKGGLLYVKTPNLWNYTMLVSRVTPVAFHNVLRSANGHADNTPTFYRANTRRRLMALAGDAGLNVKRLEMYSYSYMYYSFNKEIFLMMRGLSRLFGKLSTGMCQTLVGVFEKK
jgi:ubiquinone/menaquinone biosynthesis C-methylase UbiE